MLGTISPALTPNSERISKDCFSRKNPSGWDYFTPKTINYHLLVAILVIMSSYSYNA